ncbi:hypothetical protein [Asticcacaulis sp. AC402]|uniref:hypothetical protein n=1 Tax=Asticcacaulis sp. AC402 TaxID=1282361 RepID=UPI0003C3AC07|nr:hypothetical protein [Asticcacaulis sp. AC402]ESQ74957.1 hypothetical protein ABAC402_11175 [Asticcacaulis sp. AC402]
MSHDPNPKDSFFIGWAATPKRDRRFMLGAALAAIGAGTTLSLLMAKQHEAVGKGQWDQAKSVTLSGYFIRDPWPLLLVTQPDGTLETVLLVGNGKTAIFDRLPEPLPSFAQVTGTMIQRGAHRMLAVSDKKDWLIALSGGDNTDTVPINQYKDEGSATLSGEILDAKCWFGAMRPGNGKVHKACAALCVRGGLPVAFCTNLCSDSSDIYLVLDPDGKPHGEDILPLVADLVYADGRIVSYGGFKQFRVAIGNIIRL